MMFRIQQPSLRFSGKSSILSMKACMLYFFKMLRQYLKELLVEDGVLRCIRLKLESKKIRKKKNAAAVYLYQADNDGEWGEIHFDFVRGKAEIVRLADWDTVRTNIYAKMVIRYVIKM